MPLRANLRATGTSSATWTGPSSAGSPATVASRRILPSSNAVISTTVAHALCQ